MDAALRLSTGHFTIRYHFEHKTCRYRTWARERKNRSRSRNKEFPKGDFLLLHRAHLPPPLLPPVCLSLLFLSLAQLLSLSLSLSLCRARISERIKNKKKRKMEKKVCICVCVCVYRGIVSMIKIDCSFFFNSAEKKMSLS